MPFHFPRISFSPDLCYIQYKPGYRHLASSYELSIKTKDKADCSYQCLGRPLCKSFSYLYLASASMDNCLLSDLGIDILEARDVIKDSNWDVFEQVVDRGQCRRRGLATSVGGTILVSGEHAASKQRDVGQSGCPKVFSLKCHHNCYVVD